MSCDEFSFFNQQLAAMLRDGIPLEGALKQLSAGMKSGPLRVEVQRLEQDLAQGISLPEGLAKRDLPEFYRRMVAIGVRSNDLPGMLTLLADYYQQTNSLWTRLKGLMVYPLLVILVSLGLTLILSLVFSQFLGQFFDQFRRPAFFVVSLWIPPVVLTLLTGLAVAAVSVPSWRSRLRWRLPAFREASLAQLASAMTLMLKNGTPLPEALDLARNLEKESPAGLALAEWRAAVEAGKGKPSQWTNPPRTFPPLFLWLIQKGGEDIAAGFQKAAELYRARAGYRIELALYGALPISILFLGLMILWQMVPLFQAMISLMNALGDMGGGS